MSFIQHVERLNTFNHDNFTPFYVAAEHVGWIRPAFARLLAEYDDVFIVSDDSVKLHDRLDTFDERSDAVSLAMRSMLENGHLERLHGERYPVTPGRREDALMWIDRAVAAYFGIIAFGQHLNGYVRKPDGIYLWVAKRAMDRVHYPGKLDNLVAGGLPHELTLSENIRKECYEEAGIDRELARTASPVGAISYCCETEAGVKRDILYCYDLQLSHHFVPECTDGEVESFELLPIARVADIVNRSDSFKLNCNLVIIDFLIRFGVIPPDHVEYLALNAGLRQIGFR